MARKRSEMKDVQLVEVVETKKFEEEFFSFEQALSNYLRNKPHKKIAFKDKEAVKIVMLKRCPSLKTTIERWNKIFDEF